MFNFNGTLIYLKTITSPPNPNPLLHHYASPFSLYFSTNIPNSTSFAVSYLIHNFGFSPQSASKLCSIYRLQFTTSHNPDSVLNFFKNHNFSDSQLRDTISKAPWLLSCNPSKRVLPKFHFFLSKGASNSDIVSLVSKGPIVLKASLDNQIIPTYELAYRFLQSDKDTIAWVIQNPYFLGHYRVPYNIKLLAENGVADSNIARLLQDRSRIFMEPDMLKLVKELKDLGFNPSKTGFGVALKAKILVPKTKWKEKVDAFKKWGWSEEDVHDAFRKQPYCMLVSIEKINLVMSFWVDQFGWDAVVLTKIPVFFLLSLEKRLIPRAHVVQFLLKNGLRKKNASLTYPFVVTEKSFLDRFIKRYENESSHLLKLYEEKLNLACTADKTCIS